MNRHPDQARHPFDSRKGKPPYWLRDSPPEQVARDLEAHQKMVRDHERIHRPAR